MNKTQIPSNIPTMAARFTTAPVLQVINDWCEASGIDAGDVAARNPALNGSEAKSLPAPALLIIEQFHEDPEPIERLEAIARAMPGSTRTIFILGDPSATDIRRLFHAGANDVLSAAITPPEMMASFDAALNTGAARADARRDSGALISVIKSAGGVGGTSVSANLARTFREFDMGEIALVDLDVQFAGLTPCLDLKPRMTVIDAVRAEDRLDATLLRSLFDQHRSGFHVLAGPKSMTASEAISGAFIAKLVAQLKSEFDLVIFDLPMAWSDWFEAALSASDLIIPVLESSVRCADGARRILDALEELDLADRTILPLVNKVDRTPAAKERLSGLNHLFSGQSPMIVREDHKAFQKASDLGQCLLDIGATAAQQDYSKSVQTIASTLELEAELPVHAQSEKRFGLNLFGERA